MQHAVVYIFTLAVYFFSFSYGRAFGPTERMAFDTFIVRFALLCKTEPEPETPQFKMYTQMFLQNEIKYTRKTKKKPRERKRSNNVICLRLTSIKINIIYVQRSAVKKSVKESRLESIFHYVCALSALYLLYFVVVAVPVLSNICAMASR